MVEDRLDKIERIVETGFSDIFQSLGFLKERQENFQKQQQDFQRQQQDFQKQQEISEKKIDALAESQRLTQEAQRSMLASMERLAIVQAETSDRLASIGAAVERLDAILDYLIGRDSER